MGKPTQYTLTQKEKLKEVRKILRELELTESKYYKGKGLFSKIKNCAWTVFSAYIRQRDFKKYRGKCYTCLNRASHWSDFHCGHYISRSARNTLYDELNNHAQCPACNSPSIGNGRPKTYSYVLNKEYGVGTSDLLYDVSKLYCKDDFESHYDTFMDYADKLRKTPPNV